MKLKDLFKNIDPALQDLSRMGICLMYNGQIPRENYNYPPIWDEFIINEMALPVKWEHASSTGLNGFFNSNGYEYVIRFELFKYQIDKVNLNCVNVSFEVKVNGEYTTNLTSAGQPNQVIGTIQNALSEKIIYFDADVVLFVAIDHIEPRMRLYGRMADKFAKKFGNVYRNIKLPNGEAIAIIAKHIPEVSQKEMYQLVLDAGQDKPTIRDLESR